MASFGFTEQQEMLRQTVRDFVRRELAPGAKERAKMERVPEEIVKKLGDVGLLGLNVPEEYGGQPADFVSVGIAVEEIAKVESAPALLPALSPMFYLALRHGPEELRREWVPPMVRGEKIIALGLTEPDCGSDAVAMKTRAVRKGDSYVISGEKTSVTMGMYADAATIFAKTDPEAGARGVSCFLVPLDLPGISRSSFSDMGFRPWGRASIMLDEVSIPVQNRLGEEGKGFYIVMEQFDFVRICLALTALGMAESSLEDGISYAKQRTAFGRPIAKFEGISFKIAEGATLIEAARLLCFNSLRLIDQGLPHTKETAMCKWWVPQVAVGVIHDMLLLHGHLGYSDEFPIEQRLRDAIGMEIGDGTAQIMKAIISREIMGREFLPY